MASFCWFVTMYTLHLVRCSIVDTKNAQCYVPTEQCNTLRQKNKNSNSNRNNIFNKLSSKRPFHFSLCPHKIMYNNTYVKLLVLDRTVNAQKQRGQCRLHTSQCFHLYTYSKVLVQQSQCTATLTSVSWDLLQHHFSYSQKAFCSFVESHTLLYASKKRHAHNQKTQSPTHTHSFKDHTGVLTRFQPNVTFLRTT